LEIVQQDAISKCGHWSTMILAHLKFGQKALGLFQQMQQEGVQPDSVTFVGVLKACASMVAIEEGRCVHRDIIQSDLESDVFVGSSLVSIYAKCGSMEDAWRAFDKSFFREQCFVKENAEPFGICRNVYFQHGIFEMN
jgi:pentatricopeptide repeat protein